MMDDKKTWQVEIDKLIHEPARLKILAQLYVVEGADFVFLMNQTGLTQGNVSAHLTKLENAKYVKIEKSFVGKRPRTMIYLTKKGRVSFKEYVCQMQNIFNGLVDLDSSEVSG
jgi:DNA-binding MarR family transcriptional regulator